MNRSLNFLFIFTANYFQNIVKGRNISLISNSKNYIDSTVKFCELYKSRLFKKEDILTSNNAYRQFLQVLPLFIESEHKLYETKNIKKSAQNPLGRREQEYTNQNRFNLLGPVGPKCSFHLEQFGHFDEAKHICGLQEIQKLSNQSECVIYSIGSNNQWGFEFDILTKTSCRVETFDCTVNGIIPAELSVSQKKRIRFHKICLGSKNEQINTGNNTYRTFMDWSTLNKYLNMTTDPTFLKMDIEGYEIPVMRSIIDSRVSYPFQIAMEFHLLKASDNFNTTRSSAEVFAFMHYLSEFGGYSLIDRNDNPHCQQCSEILLARTRCDIVASSSFDAIKTPSHPKFDAAVKNTLSNN